MRIGIFDSGYGGLTIFSRVRRRLPDYDYIYLGDNARAPYGTRSFEVVYRFTLQAVRRLFDMGCGLVVLACNTASAKALRSIQQRDLPTIDPQGRRRVLGIIRPSVEALGSLTKTGSVGLCATTGTVESLSYQIEMRKMWPQVRVAQQACPMWIPIVENGEFDSEGADWFVDKYIGELLGKAPDMDTLLLACTHFPLLLPKIRRRVPHNVRIVEQGDIVADSLALYLQRHSDLAAELSKGGAATFHTTESAERFQRTAAIFFKGMLDVTHIELA